MFDHVVNNTVCMFACNENSLQVASNNKTIKAWQAAACVNETVLFSSGMPTLTKLKKGDVMTMRHQYSIHIYYTCHEHEVFVNACKGIQLSNSQIYHKLLLNHHQHSVRGMREISSPALVLDLKTQGVTRSCYHSCMIVVIKQISGETPV